MSRNSETASKYLKHAEELVDTDPVQAAVYADMANAATRAMVAANLDYIGRVLDQWHTEEAASE